MRGSFPFRRLSREKYLTLEVIMYVEHPNSLQFMYDINKETRAFIEENFITIRNGFINEGLITHDLHVYECGDYYNFFYQLEKLYFSALTRNFKNRVITIKVDI